MDTFEKIVAAFFVAGIVFLFSMLGFFGAEWILKELRRAQYIEQCEEIFLPLQCTMQWETSQKD